MVLGGSLFQAPGHSAYAQYVPVTISFLTHWPPDTVAKLAQAAQKYMKDQPGTTIQIRAVPFGDLLTTILSQAGASNTFTIAGIYDLWLPELVRDGIVIEAPEANAAEVKKEWPDSAVDAASVGGKLFGYPNEIDLYVLNYNKKLFGAAGLSGPPRTWDELAADAEKLTKRDGNETTQQGFGFINSWAAGVVHPFAALLAANSGQLIVDGRPALESKAATQTFEFVQKLIDAKVTNPTMGTADANTTGPYLDNFVAGKTAMIIMANWWESALRTGMGEASFANIATAPIPVGPSGDISRTISYVWLTVVNAAATEAQRQAAWKFLSWLDAPASGENGASAMGDLLVSMGILPSRQSDGVAFSQRLNSPFLAGYVSQLKTAKPFPVVLGGQEFTDALQHRLEAMQFGQERAAQAQEQAQRDAESILSKASHR
jgi:multiple sugar transport system substrate-binding protein